MGDLSEWEGRSRGSRYSISHRRERHEYLEEDTGRREECFRGCSVKTLESTCWVKGKSQWRGRT